MRDQARAEGRPVRYDGRWRDRDPAEAPAGVPPVVRLRAPQNGETVIDDQVQGRVTVRNAELDDMVLLRADGTPTYMLSVVVDDIDMGITHVVRGDDHLTNAFRQTQLFRALGAETPTFAHVPLIHGADGAKLSKRHGAVGVETFRDMGMLPEAMRNYLLRLGWGHGDDEVISTEQAVAWFDLDGVGQSPARLDFAKLENLNGIYLRQTDPNRLVDLVVPKIEAILGGPVDALGRARVVAGMDGLRQRAKNLNELSESAVFYIRSIPLPQTDKARKLLGGDAAQHLQRLAARLQAQEDWSEAALEATVRSFAEAESLKMGAIAQPLRAALTGSHVSPGIFEVAAVLGREEALSRIADVT